MLPVLKETNSIATGIQLNLTFQVNPVAINIMTVPLQLPCKTVNVFDPVQSSSCTRFSYHPLSHNPDLPTDSILIIQFFITGIPNIYGGTKDLKCQK